MGCASSTPATARAPVEPPAVVAAAPPLPALAPYTPLPPPVNTSSDLVGTQIKQYTVGRLIGEGAQGEVHEVTETSTGRVFAMKVVVKRPNLRRGLSGQQQRDGKFGLASGQVAREVALMKKLVHVNLVGLYEVLDDPNETRLFLVMEYVDGGPAMHDDMEDQEPLSEDVARNYFRQLVRGLDYLHFHGVVHRDIKPSNLLVTRQGVLKICDFGISMLCKPREDVVTRNKHSMSARRISVDQRQRVESSTGTPSKADGHSLAPRRRSSLDRPLSSSTTPGPERPTTLSPQRQSSDDSVVDEGERALAHLDVAQINALPVRNIPDTPFAPVTPILHRKNAPVAPVHDDTVTTGTGTFAFYPPEACVDGEATYHGFAADLWASGVTLYMFLFGRVPFASEDKAELFRRIREDDVEFPLEPGRKPISSDAISLLKQMLSKQASKRPTVRKLRKNKWVAKAEGVVPALSKDETKEMQVSFTDVESALTHVDLSVAVRLLVRSKSWSAKPQDVVQSRVQLHKLIDSLPKPEDGATKSVAAAGDAFDAGAPKLALDTKVKENRNSVRPMTLPSRALRPEGGLVSEFDNAAWRPAQTPSSLLEEIRSRSSTDKKPAVARLSSEEIRPEPLSFTPAPPVVRPGNGKTHGAPSAAVNGSASLSPSASAVNAAAASDETL